MSLNLHTLAGGLYGTHVTWEDVEEDMQRELDTVASFGPGKCAKDVGAGNGFMSKLLLIDPDWQHVDKKLPQKFVVKILTQLAVQEMSAQISKHGNTDNSFSDPKFKEEMEVVQKICHNTEVRTYKHLMKIPKEKMHIPKIYYAKMFTDWNPVKGYIIMEYFDNLKAVHMYENIAPQYLKQVLRYKAAMEASSLDMPPEERQMYTSPFKTLFDAVYSEKVSLHFILDHVMALFRKFNDGKLADKAERLQAILLDMMEFERVDNLANNLGMESVLCHGDLWSMNILWRQKGDDLTMAAVVDYQTVHFGCAATDLVRLFTTCLSGKDRQSQWEPLLEEFYGYLKQEVGERKMPYTLEQLKEAYRQYFPIGAFMIAPKIGPYFEMVRGSSSDDAKKKGMDTVLEKTECLLDDIFYYHDRNMKLRNSEKVTQEL